MRQAIELSILGFVIALAMLVATGCGSPQAVAYKAEAASVVTVEQAMYAWGDYVNQFQPGPRQEQRVKEAYEKYQAAMSAAITASSLAVSIVETRTNSAGIVESKNVQSGEREHQRATEAATELINLIRKLGVKL